MTSNDYIAYSQAADPGLIPHECGKLANLENDLTGITRQNGYSTGTHQYLGKI